MKSSFYNLYSNIIYYLILLIRIYIEYLFYICIGFINFISIADVDVFFRKGVTGYDSSSGGVDRNRFRFTLLRSTVGVGCNDRA